MALAYYLIQALYFLFSSCFASAQNLTYTTLNVTTIASHNGYSVLECWQLNSVPVFARSAINYPIDTKLTKATWSMLNPKTYVGEAWAPAVQLTIVLKGLIRVTAPFNPNSNDSCSLGPFSANHRCAVTSRPPQEQQEAYLMPGTIRSSILLATDLRDISHITGHGAYFPSDEPTVLVQIPFDNNEIPPHTVVGSGACV